MDKVVMTSDEELQRKLRARESVRRAREAIASADATLARSKEPPPNRQWGAGVVQKSNHQIELENRLDRYTAGDLTALDGFDEPSLPVETREVVVQSRKRPTMNMQEQQLNEWFSKSFALHIEAALSPFVAEFNKSNENISAMFDHLETILDEIDKDLEAVPVNLANAISSARISIRKQVNDDVQTDLNVMMKDVEKVLISKMASRMKALRTAMKTSKASSDNVTNLHQRKS
jgi:hypothetical protein